MPKPLTYKGRGSIGNAAGRFEKQSSHAEDGGWDGLDAELPPLHTEVVVDSSRSLITCNDSPDIPFDRSINPGVYRVSDPAHPNDVLKALLQKGNRRDKEEKLRKLHELCSIEYSRHSQGVRDLSIAYMARAA